MNMNQLLERILKLTQVVEDSTCGEMTSAEQLWCHELADLTGKLAERVSCGEMPDRWKQAIPWLAPMKQFQCNLGTMGQVEADHVERVLGTSTLVGWSESRELADLACITKVEAAHVIHAGVLARIAESDG